MIALNSFVIQIETLTAIKNCRISQNCWKTADVERLRDCNKSQDFEFPQTKLKIATIDIALMKI